MYRGPEPEALPDVVQQRLIQLLKGLYAHSEEIRQAMVLVCECSQKAIRRNSRKEAVFFDQDHDHRIGRYELIGYEYTDGSLLVTLKTESRGTGGGLNILEEQLAEEFFSYGPPDWIGSGATYDELALIRPR